ncbi:MAG TPA: hypothetical protein V6D17_03635 [Candidatus Obscuribacterales bacterium]
MLKKTTNGLKALHSVRNAHGGAGMSEFGPALFVLLICFFFPLIDLIGVGVSYALCMVLNSNQAHEAALMPRQEANSENGLIKKGIPERWQNGMGRFVKMVGSPKTSLSYRELMKVSHKPGTDDSVQGAKDTEKAVMVTTTVTCSPFLPIPLPWASIPGLNAPMTFVVSSERAMENPDYGIE